MNSYKLSKDGGNHGYQEGFFVDLLQYDSSAFVDDFPPTTSITSSCGSPNASDGGLPVHEYYTSPRNLPGDGMRPISAWPQTTIPTLPDFDVGYPLYDLESRLCLDSSGGGYYPVRSASPKQALLVDSKVPAETEDSKPREKTQHWCHVCRKEFESSQSLEAHAKSENHRPYRCDLCTKSYSRRDVLLRHKAMHKDGGHRCPYCPKVKTRKDKLKDHIRNCHGEQGSPCARSTSISEPSHDLPSFDLLVQKLNSDTDSEFSFADDAQALDQYALQQKQSMREVVKSLKSLLGEQSQSLIDKLENSVENMNGSSMELLAQNMAHMAVMHANLSAARLNCP